MNILDSFLVHFSMHNRMWHMQMTVLELRNLNGYSYILVASCPQMVACAWYNSEICYTVRDG